MYQTTKGKTIYLSKTKKRRKNNKNNIKLILLMIVFIGALTGVVIAFLPNAYEVKIGEKVVGVVKQKNMVELAEKTVMSQLESQYNSKVKLEGTPAVNKVRAKKKELISLEYLTSALRANMNFKVEFKEIKVDGKGIGIIKDEKELEDLKLRLIEEYLDEEYTVNQVDFTNKVELVSVYATEKELVPLDVLVEKCITTSEEEVEYEVVPGDTQWGITTKLGITMLDLEDANPGLTENTKLKIGSKLKAIIDVPVLTVKVKPEVVESQKLSESNEAK